MTLYSVEIGLLLSIHKYQCNCHSYFSSWRMSEDSLSEGGWHTIGTLGDGLNRSKELREMLSGDNPTKDIFRLVRGTHMPHLTFLTREELYPWLMRTSCSVLACNMSSKSSSICYVRPWKPERLSGNVGIKIRTMWVRCKIECRERCMLVNHMWWLLGYVWDLTSVFLVPKGREYTLPYYHF